MKIYLDTLIKVINELENKEYEIVKGHTIKGITHEEISDCIIIVDKVLKIKDFNAVETDGNRKITCKADKNIRFDGDKIMDYIFGYIHGCNYNSEDSSNYYTDSTVVCRLLWPCMSKKEIDLFIISIGYKQQIEDIREIALSVYKVGELK